MTTSSVLMKEVRSHIGEGGSVFQKWAGIPGQPWCDAYVAYCENKTGNGALYCDGAKEINCPHSMEWCLKHLAAIPIYLAMEGDVSFFDWQPNGLPDHVGFVDERKNADYYYTIEGNTSGGIVARRKRSDEEEQLTFRLHYTPTAFSADKKLDVDGIAGYSTIAVMQRWLNVEKDAILGQGTVKALQKKLGVTADGLWGVKTTKALQKLVGATQDGLMGPDSVKAFQKYLNAHAFADADPQPTPSTGKYKVIDVSVWQGTIDWSKVKADGVVGAIIRYADGNTLDSKFDYNMKQAKANGIHIGSYIFSRAKTKAEAEAEATRLYNACKPYAPDLPLYIDLEDAKLKSYANIVAQAFLRKMVALGGKGGVYANLNWWNNYLAETARDYSSNAFWIAQYYDKVTHKNPSLFGMWQYSSSGSVNGISGRVDMDWLYIPYWEKKNSVKTNGQKIGEKANELAYSTAPAEAKYPSGHAKASYKSALEKVYPNRSKWGKAPKVGASCDVFVGTCIRASGVDPNFPRGLADQRPYLAKSNKFTKVLELTSRNLKESDLQNGDIITYNYTKGGGHICIWYNGKLKHASVKEWYGRTTTEGGRFKISGKNYIQVWRAK